MLEDLNKKLNHLAHIGMQDSFSTDMASLLKSKKRNVERVAYPKNSGEKRSYKQLSLFNSL